MIGKDELEKRLFTVKERIDKAALRINRDSSEINIVAITKNVDIETVKNIQGLGISNFGENRIQELIKKSAEIKSPVTWHMVGHLQTNKVKKGISCFDYMHSLDSLHLAKTLEKELSAQNKIIKAFIQVNVSGEETKFGIKPAELKEFYEKSKRFSHLKLIGLMTMAPEFEDPQIARPIFRELKNLINNLRDSIDNTEKADFKHLSMGMSNDFEVAIEEGATFIRIGSVLFKE
jgi:pyridoxal phosphate enzyme (YggS family)